jgi:hypothetical protein
LAFPDWIAVIEQTPPANGVTVEPLTEQTFGVVETKLTVKPEVEVAVIENGGTVSVILLKGAKVRV